MNRAERHMHSAQVHCEHKKGVDSGSPGNKLPHTCFLPFLGRVQESDWDMKLVIARLQFCELSEEMLSFFASLVFFGFSKLWQISTKLYHDEKKVVQNS